MAKIKLSIIFESGARIGPGKAMPLAPGSDRLASDITHGPDHQRAAGAVDPPQAL